MGIKNLNRFLREECSNSINILNIKDLTGKKIVIDISIYLYKFQAENALIENMYLMLSIFNHYKIIPIFIFDGKPPNEKKELLQKRFQDKKKAEAEYCALKELDMDVLSDEQMKKMSCLKKRFIYFRKEQIDKIKKLIHACGANYYDAPGEADELCALLVIKNKAWACLSEDMDMFAYGCPRVLRYISLLNHTIVLYDYESILGKLGLTQQGLREICVLSGTDYNTIKGNTPFSLKKALKIYEGYREKNLNTNNDFYTWLMNEKYVIDCQYLKNIDNIFDFVEIEKRIPNKILEEIDANKEEPILKEELRNILSEDGFIFK